MFAASYSSRAGALPAPFDTARSMLASSRFNIEVSPLPGSPPVAVTEQRAEDIALQHFGAAPTTAGVTATLVSATDKEYATVATDGTRTPVISNRSAWLVLVPDQHVPIFYPQGKNGPATYTATIAALIDANTGDFLEAAALNG